MEPIDLSLSGGRLGSPGLTPGPEFSCGEHLWSSNRLGAIADTSVMQRVTLFPHLPDPLDSVCSGSGFHECECYNDQRCQVRAYSRPITQPGPFLREILLLCESCRERLQANGEIEIVPPP